MLRDNELNCQALTLFKTIYSSLLLIWRYCEESIMQHYKCTEAYSGGGLLATVPPPAYELGLAPPPTWTSEIYDFQVPTGAEKYLSPLPEYEPVK